MAVAKTNPLPVGLYTMDLPASSAPRLAAWTKGNRGKVVVRKVVANERDSSCAVVFEVIGRPGAFPFGAVGYPTIATSSTGSLDDPFAWISESASQLEGLALLFVLWQLMKR